MRCGASEEAWLREHCRSGTRASHGSGKPASPVGAERMGKDGYVMVKVAERPSVPQTKDNWRLRHHLVWEEANGRPVPDGHVVMFADGDKRNFDPANLVAVPRRYVCQLNNPGLPSCSDAATLGACIALCDMHAALADAEGRRPRECGVCGREFTPTAAQARFPKPVRTCPECRAAGRRAKGGTGSAAGECAVCGAAFAGKRGQRRCPECIAEHPKWSVGAHLAERDRKETA